MDPEVYSKAEEIEDVSAQRPHFVILGAGASLAACPGGDLNGHHLPVMLDLVETLDLASILSRAGVRHGGRNFEDVYDDIHRNPNLTPVRLVIEQRVAEYFSQLQLPAKPTVYDYIVLSLRPKDGIATFNWDPFLWQACERNRHVAPLPNVFFLHGCSIIGYCAKDKIQGPHGAPCPGCGDHFAPTKLLYPVANKDYVSDPYLASQWESLRAGLNKAFVLTIFGYGAPASDAAAIDLMSTAWGRPAQRVMEQIEIIDIKSEEEVLQSWDRFICRQHYEITSSYFDSLLSTHPRRTCEALWQSLFEARFREGNPIPRIDSLEELWDWFRALRRAEN